MKKLWDLIRRGGFLILLALVLLAGETVLRRTDPVKYSTAIWRNDFELIELAHPDMTFQRAFYGSSILIASYMDDRNDNGYVNLGIDYGTVLDLKGMLEKDLVTVEEDLVVALDELTLMDTMDTNKTYPWHHKWYEPYLYFHRDRLSDLITKGVNYWLRGESFIGYRFDGQERAVYHWALSDEDLKAHEGRIVAAYGETALEDCEENFEALEWVARYCEERNICLRVVWMPLHPKTELYPAGQAIMDEANRRLEALGVPVLDLTNEIPSEWMYDMRHVSWEYGAAKFTDYIDPWLSKEVEHP